MLSLQNKVDIRRHLGVPFAGYPTAGVTGGIRIVQSTGQLETYMSSLQASEESILTGNVIAQIRLFGSPAIGNTVTLTINNTPVTYTVQASDFGPNNTPLYGNPIAPLESVAYNLASAVCATPNLGVLGSGGANYGATPPITLPDGAEVILTGLTGTFTVTTSSTGISALVIQNGTTYPNPQLAITNTNGSSSTIYGYIPICNFLESQVLTPNLSLRYKVAKTVTFREDETAARVIQYRWACMQLGNLLSVGLEAGMLARIGSNTALRLTV